MPETQASDSLSITLNAPHSVQRGDDVPFTIAVRNTSARALELSLGGRQIAFDIIVSRGGNVVWQRLHGATIPAILQLKTLQPEESFELKDVWQANVDPGRYDVAAKILTDAEPLTPAPTKINVL